MGAHCKEIVRIYEKYNKEARGRERERAVSVHNKVKWECRTCKEILNLLSEGKLYLDPTINNMDSF